MEQLQMMDTPSTPMPEQRKARELVDRANTRLGTRWSMRGQAPRRALARVRQYPDLSLDRMLDIVDEVCASEYWNGSVSPPCIFGEGVWARRTAPVKTPRPGQDGYVPTWARNARNWPYV